MSKQPAPKKPPFKVGTVLVYRGDRQLYKSHDLSTPLLVAGMRGTIMQAKPGTQGSGRWIVLDGDAHDDGFEDKTRDGTNVIQMESGHRSLIYPDDRKEWELVAQPQPA